MKNPDNKYLISAIIALILVIIGVFGLITYLKNIKTTVIETPTTNEEKEKTQEQKEVEIPKNENENKENTEAPSANAAGPVTGPQTLPNTQQTPSTYQWPQVKIPVSGPSE